MLESIYEITRMDCPSEENLIRMKLEAVPGIRHLEFDIPNRKLTVFHTGGVEPVSKAIDTLDLGSRLVNSDATERDDFERDERQRSLLWTVLAINALFFAVEMAAGWWSGSMGLVADSLDMLADASVYGLSLMAVGGAMIRKKRIAKLAGYFQISLAVLGFAEVIRRFVGVEAVPEFRTMIVVSVLALAANGICLYLLQRSKSREAHMQASMIFTSNDVIINLGVIVAAVLVHGLDSGLPDLIVGAIVFLLVSRGAGRILKLAK